MQVIHKQVDLHHMILVMYQNQKELMFQAILLQILEQVLKSVMMNYHSKKEERRWQNLIVERKKFV